MIAGVTAALVTQVVAAQYDSSTLVDTNNTSTSTSTVTSTNTNNNNNTNINDTTVNSTATNTNTNNNTNVNTSTSTSTSTSTNTNNNNNVNTTTSDNTNRNINSGEQTFNNNNVTTSTNTNINTSTVNSTNTNVNTTTQEITSDNRNENVNVNTSTSTNRNENVNTSTQTSNNVNDNRNDTRIDQTVRTPPPTAVAPAMMSGGNSDLCTTGTSGAVQTQIMGVSSGGVLRDKNCERLKNAKTLYDMGMKVAAVSVLCQDRRVFDAMWNAGTPCPFEGQIGEQARVAWQANPDRIPAPEPEERDDFYAKASFGALLGYLLFIL